MPNFFFTSLVFHLNFSRNFSTFLINFRNAYTFQKQKKKKTKNDEKFSEKQVKVK